MTLNVRTAVDYAPLRAPEAQQALADQRADSIWSDRIVFPILVVALLLLYGMLQNPYWVPAGDSELYATAARNVALGQGYVFLGQPVAISPPGWSWMMAAVMYVTPYVWPLKLLAMGCLTASLLVGYWIARRFVTPPKAAAVILLTAVLSHVYQATYWLISEGAFCLATAGSILLAMQIAEGRRQAWRIALLLFCCAAAVTIRWAGVLGMVLVVAALLDGQWRPRPSATWMLSIVVVLVSIATFIGWRQGLRGTPEQIAAAADVITGTGEDVGIPPVEAPVTGAPDQSARTYELFPAGSLGDRFLNWGRWFSFLYWQPFRAAGASVWILRLSTIAGWMVIAVLAVLVVTSALRLRWIWLAAGAYTGALAMGWPNVNARYYVPVAFLITLGMFLASDELTRLTVRWPKWRAAVVGAFLLFVGSVLLCNGALYAIEARIARSERFYSKYETGMTMGLIAACQHLTSLPEPPRDGQLAVSARYVNLNRAKASPFGLRATAWLTGLNEIHSPKWVDTNAPPTTNPRLRRWLRSKGVKWYLYQPEISPWRVWHFRVRWYEKWQTGKTAQRDSGGWQLYRAVPTEDGGEDWTQVRLPRRSRPVTRVPGL